MASNRSKDNGQETKKLGGISDLRTPMKARLRSKPEVEGQEYLDMYVLTRDRARWRRMKKQSAEATEAIDEEIARIGNALPASEQTQNEDHDSGPSRKRPGKKFGTFRVEY